MRVAISGASGLVGTALAEAIEASGGEVLRLVRRTARSPNEVSWDPSAGTVEAAKLEALDAVYHAAGAPIAAGRWTDERKAAIRNSRVDGTRTLATALAGLDAPPPVFVSFSAIGFYGSRGDEVLTEASAPGDGFLAEVCQAWEASADPARDAGIRVVHPRLGMVLSPDGGALEKMLPPFKLGVGGPVGDGQQWVSWIALSDLVALLRYLAENDVEGPVNAVAPSPVRNAAFSKALASAVNRPSWLPAPKFALRAAMGELADALLLSSQRVQPTVAVASGFKYTYAEVAPALNALL